MSEFILKCTDVQKSYGKLNILDDIDLSVRPGELVTLVGPSGCGKSTLLRCILGQEFPTSGSIEIDGKNVGFPNTDRGIVFQKYGLYPHMTVLQNVTAGGRLTAFPWERKKLRANREEAMEFLRRVRLDEHTNKYPHQLSGGMQQRVAIAQALIMKPKVLLMDEPFGALDPATKKEIQVFLLELWEQENLTIFFVTHDLKEACYLGTRTLVLSQHYNDDRGPEYKRGSRIVVDRPLASRALSTEVKKKKGFEDLVAELEQDGFDPEYLQHVRDFNLIHPDSWQSLDPEVDTQS